MQTIAGIPIVGAASSPAELVRQLRQAAGRDQANAVLLRPLGLSPRTHFRPASTRRRRGYRQRPRRCDQATI